MSVTQIKSFSDKAKADPDLQEKLKNCERAKELVILAGEYGFKFPEDDLYPPNEPAFSEDQLHAKLVKLLLRS